MLQMESKVKPRLQVLLALGCWMTCWTTMSTLAAADELCATAVPLDLPSQWRGVGTQADASRLVRYEVPSASVLTLDVTVPAAASAEPVLDVVGRGCGGRQKAGDFAYIERTASHQVLAIRTPGEYFVRVAAHDPTLDLGDYKLTAGLVEQEYSGSCSKIGDPAEDEPEPDPFSSGGCSKIGDPAEDEPEPDPLTGVRLTRGTGWCSSSEIDDHGDTFTCATRLGLGREVKGEISSDWGDDEDTFVFFLTELRTVEIESTGETDTTGTLYDRYAHRLAMDEDGGHEDNFRMIKTLAPGRYFVRIEGGLHAEGPYRLSVRVLNRR